MGVSYDLDHHRERVELARELEGVSRSLITHFMTVELALQRRDWRAVHEASETVYELMERFGQLRRGLLVLGATK